MQDLLLLQLMKKISYYVVGMRNMDLCIQEQRYLIFFHSHFEEIITWNNCLFLKLRIHLRKSKEEEND